MTAQVDRERFRSLGRRHPRSDSRPWTSPAVQPTHGVWVGWKYAPDGTVRVTIGGDLCYDTVGDLDGIDERLVPTPGGRVTLDLGSIEFIDSRGVTFVLRMRDAMIVHGARCEVISAAPLVRRVLTILELDRDLIPSCPRATRRQRR